MDKEFDPLFYDYFARMGAIFRIQRYELPGNIEPNQTKTIKI